ncbi:helix-turn-helix transcriptional regulator [Deinococcus detaillensis]|uniref:Helix-turn-helix transcriptional regulator n=1 Tax=Deinococcus detaillensis TaxID=2592048 RepID=A0A553UX75_9DEIO|nr:helix-turn-helix transcriptional regulator [Deinococcus detaillensis]TSA84621.1 helix-turn-helix transcriptional regulator [Deinococcus detaillensis]
MNLTPKSQPKEDAMPNDTLNDDQRTHIYTLKNGATLSILDVPAKIDLHEPDFQAYTVDVARRLSVAGLAFEAQNPNPEVRQIMNYAELAPLPAPSPVSLEIRRALLARKLRPADLARKLGVAPSAVARWLDPSYYQHSTATLTKIAEALESELEIHFKLRAS